MSDDHTTNDDGEKLLYCSFCGKSQHEVRKLIAGPSVFVCDECVELCNDIIREEVEEKSTVAKGSKLPPPHEINEILNSLPGKLRERLLIAYVNDLFRYQQ